MTNSSPPQRATRSELLTTDRITSARICSASEPASCRSGPVVIQHVSHFPGETHWCEWLLKKARLGFETERLVRIPGYEQRPHPRPEWGEELDELPATHPRHDDVRDQQVDRPGVLLRDEEPLLSIPGLENGVAARLQRQARQRADGVLVFDQENRLGTPGGCGRPGRRANELSAPLGTWQIELAMCLAPLRSSA